MTLTFQDFKEFLQRAIRRFWVDHPELLEVVWRLDLHNFADLSQRFRPKCVVVVIENSQAGLALEPSQDFGKCFVLHPVLVEADLCNPELSVLA
jgi:hypothetical protein